MTSRLRKIILQADAKVLKESFEDVFHFSQMRPETLERVAQRIRTAAASPASTILTKMELEYDPSLKQTQWFQHLLTLQQSRNFFYRVAAIIAFMTKEPDVFGYWMLRGESARFQDYFMKVIKEAFLYFILGVRIENGDPYQPGENLLQRRTGRFVLYVMEQFSTYV
jgi:hypothetical protein